MLKSKKKRNKKLIILLIFILIAILGLLTTVFLLTTHNEEFLTGDKVNIQVNDSETYVFTVIKDSGKSDEMITAILDGYYEEDGERWFLDYESDSIISLLDWDKPKKVRMLSLDEAEKLGCSENWDNVCEWLSKDLTYPGSQKAGFYQYAFWIDAKNSISRRYVVDEQGFLDTEDKNEYRGIRPVVYVSKKYVSPR